MRRGLFYIEPTLELPPHEATYIISGGVIENIGIYPVD
jgi:hypothetical protein